MVQKNITLNELDDESHNIVDQYLFGSNSYGYEDSCNYYDINVHNILTPYKKSDNKYVIRYIDVNKLKNAPLQLKIKNFFW